MWSHTHKDTHPGHAYIQTYRIKLDCKSPVVRSEHAARLEHSLDFLENSVSIRRMARALDSKSTLKRALSSQMVVNQYRTDAGL